MSNETRIEQLIALRNDLSARLNRLECSKNSATCVIEFNRRYSAFLKNEISVINEKMISLYEKRNSKNA